MSTAAETAHTSTQGNIERRINHLEDLATRSEKVHAELASRLEGVRVDVPPNPMLVASPKETDVVPESMVSCRLAEITSRLEATLQGLQNIVSSLDI